MNKLLNNVQTMKELVEIQNGKPTTNSLLVSERFGKNHRDVIRTIKTMTAQNCAVLNMFVETTFGIFNRFFNRLKIVPITKRKKRLENFAGSRASQY